MNWYINRKKQDELVQAEKGVRLWTIITTSGYQMYLSNFDFQSQYGEAMICPKKDCKIPDCSSLKPHICNSGCTSPSFCPHCVCYTPEQELSDDELQEPKAGAMEMLLEATNPNCKEKPDSSLLLSDEEICDKHCPHGSKYCKHPMDKHKCGIVIFYKETYMELLDHLAKLGEKVWYCTEKHKCKWQCFALNAGLAWGEVVDTFDAWRQYHDKECTGKLIQCIAIPLSDYMKGEGK